MLMPVRINAIRTNVNMVNGVRMFWLNISASFPICTNLTEDQNGEEDEEDDEIDPEHGGDEDEADDLEPANFLHEADGQQCEADKGWQGAAPHDGRDGEGSDEAVFGFFGEGHAWLKAGCELIREANGCRERFLTTKTRRHKGEINRRDRKERRELF
jgi:hypothetical protein